MVGVELLEQMKVIFPAKILAFPGKKKHRLSKILNTCGCNFLAVLPPPTLANMQMVCQLSVQHFNLKVRFLEL